MDADLRGHELVKEAEVKEEAEAQRGKSHDASLRFGLLRTEIYCKSRT